MAGIIDLNLLAPGIEAYRKERELRELSGERQKRAAELEKVKLKVKEQEEKVAKLNEEKEKAEKEKWNILNLLKKQDISIEEMEKQLTEATSLRDQAQKSLNMENEAFNTWVAEKQQVYMTIKAEVDDIKKKALEEGQSVKSDWQQLSDQYKADERSRKIEAMQQRSQNMEAYSEEALVALDKEPMEQEEREESTEQNEPA